MKGKQLASLRKMRGWTQDMAAARLGISKRTLIRWEQALTPIPKYHILRLCEIYVCKEEDLGIYQQQEEETLSLPPLLTSFFAQDLATRLLTLTFMKPCRMIDVQHQVRSLLEEFDAMTTDLLSRRKALQQMIAYAIAGASVALIPQQEETLKRYAASITACQELGRSKHTTDLLFAFEGASTLLQKLQPFLKETRSHQEASMLATQASIVCAVLGRHLKGTQVAIQYAQEAVKYGHDAPIIERVESLVALSWAYYYSAAVTHKALPLAEEAASVLNEGQRSAPPALYGQVYSVLAVMQAKNFIPNDRALNRATQHITAGVYSSTDDPIAVLLLNEARTLDYRGDHPSALSTTAQLIDVTTFTTKRTMSERERIAALMLTTKASLKAKDRDLEQSVALWKETMTSVRALQSEQRFEEAVSTYHTMDILWQADPRITALQPLTLHW